EPPHHPKYPPAGF
ncbi:hypothetical protein TSUD_266980, partial [Trifolium subterraneum]